MLNKAQEYLSKLIKEKMNAGGDYLLGHQEREVDDTPVSPFDCIKDLSPPIQMPKCASELRTVFDEICRRSDLTDVMRKALYVKILHFFNSSLHIGRSSGRVTILLMGKTGEGKSRTINKLAGAPLLETGGDESTTKVVQRIKIPVAHQGVVVELALDDTPGLDDTAVCDRDRNTVIFHRYCQRFSSFANEKEINELVDVLREVGCSEFVPTIRSTFRLAAFPNLIILVTKWQSIQNDAKNEPHQFQSPIGRTIWTLFQSGLYDADRPNVIVVVTAATSSYKSEYEDEEDEEKKHGAWKRDAAKKKRFIYDICDRALPGCEPWPVVFVENGTGRKGLARFETLPNGEQSHLNLFDAMRTMFNQDPNMADVQALHGITVLAKGAKDAHAEKETVVTLTSNEVITDEEVQQARKRIGRPATMTRSTKSPDIPEVGLTTAKQTLGVSFNPLTGRFVYSPLIRREDMKFRFRPNANRHFERISLLKGERHQRTISVTQIGLTYDTKPLSGLNLGSGTGSHAQTAYGGSIQNFEAVKVISTVSFDSLAPRLSEEFLALVRSLPQWDQNDERVRSAYADHFAEYGTHFVSSAALGGCIHLSNHSQRQLNENEVADAFSAGIWNFGASHTSLQSRRADVSTFEMTFSIEGGSPAAARAQQALQNLFASNNRAARSNWNAARSCWLDALTEDPIFLILERETTMMPISRAAGLSTQLKESLQEALKWYLGKEPVPTRPSQSEPNLDRENVWENLKESMDDAARREESKSECCVIS